MPDWPILLETEDGLLLDTITTDSGRYWFLELRPGVYTATELLRDGWQQTWPPPPGEHTVHLEPGDVVEGIDFGNQPENDLGSIHGMKWHDLNGNAEKDPDEPGLGEWVICIQDADGLVACTVTNADGHYRFMNLHPGPYRVYEDLKNRHEWSQTFPVGSSHHEVVVESGQAVEGVDFGNIDRLIVGVSLTGMFISRHIWTMFPSGCGLSTTPMLIIRTMLASLAWKA